MFTSILVQLDLFTTLKYLGFLGIFLVFVGHRTLSYLSSVSTKQKTAWVDNANRVFPIIHFWGGHCRPLGVFAWYSDRTLDFLEDSAYFSWLRRNTDTRKSSRTSPSCIMMMYWQFLNRIACLIIELIIWSLAISLEDTALKRAEVLQ
jgi:hypothetical protein